MSLLSKSISMLFTAALCATVSATAYTGRVVDIYARPITGATVTLKGTNITITTDEDGLFAIDKSSPVINNNHLPQNSLMSLRSGQLTFVLKASEQVSITLYGLNGRLLKSLDKGTLTAGVHQINLFESIADGIYITRIVVGDEVQTFKCSHNSGFTKALALHAPTHNIQRARQERNSIKDTLIVDYDTSMVRSYELDLRPFSTICLASNNPNADKDKDGLPDYKEVNDYQTNPGLKDTDEDGFEDFFETGYGVELLNPSVTNKAIIKVNVTSMPRLSLNYYESTDTTEFESIKKGSEGTNSTSLVNASSKTSRVEQKKMEAEAEGGNWATKLIGSHIYNASFSGSSETNSREESRSWSSEQSKQQKLELVKLSEFSVNKSKELFSGNITVTVSVTNNSVITCDIDSLRLALGITDYHGNYHPIGEMSRTGSFTLAGGATKGDLYFTLDSIDLDKAKLFMSSSSITLTPSTMKVTHHELLNGSDAATAKTGEQNRTALLEVDMGKNSYRRSIQVHENFVHPDTLIDSISLRDMLLRTKLPVSFTEKGHIKMFDSTFSRDSITLDSALVLDATKASKAWWTVVKQDGFGTDEKYSVTSFKDTNATPVDSIWISGFDRVLVYYTEDRDGDGLTSSLEEALGTSDSLINSDGDSRNDWEEYQDSTRNPAVRDDMIDVFEATSFTLSVTDTSAITARYEIPAIEGVTESGALLLKTDLDTTLLMRPTLKDTTLATIPEVGHTLSILKTPFIVVATGTEGTITYDPDRLFDIKGTYSVLPYIKIGDSLIWGNASEYNRSIRDFEKRVYVVQEADTMVTIPMDDKDSLWVYDMQGSIYVKQFVFYSLKTLYPERQYRLHFDLDGNSKAENQRPNYRFEVTLSGHYDEAWASRFNPQGYADFCDGLYHRVRNDNVYGYNNIGIGIGINKWYDMDPKQVDMEYMNSYAKGGGAFSGPLKASFKKDDTYRYRCLLKWYAQFGLLHHEATNTFTSEARNNELPYYCLMYKGKDEYWKGIKSADETHSGTEFPVNFEKMKPTAVTSSGDITFAINREKKENITDLIPHNDKDNSYTFKVIKSSINK